MTEAEWNVCNDPHVIIEYQRYVATERKMRLFVAAACRKKLSAKDHVLLSLLEQLAEGTADSRKIASRRKPQNLSKGHFLTNRFATNYSSHALLSLNPYQAAIEATWYTTSGGPPKSRCSTDSQPALHNCNLLRDIFGNPFCPISIEAAGLTATVTQLAETIYQDRSFGSMPILADALENAGCTNADILNHCRQPGEHVRGCWVIDLLTGRK